MLVRAGCLLSVMIAVVCVGCSGGPSGPPQVPVKGTVNLDEKPMASGDIMFVLPGLVPDTIKVTDGKFEGKAKVGDAKVEIRSYKRGEPNEMYPDKEPSMENFIPAEYNTNSKLKANITEGGTNEFKFDVKSN